MVAIRGGKTETVIQVAFTVFPCSFELMKDIDDQPPEYLRGCCFNDEFHTGPAQEILNVHGWSGTAARLCSPAGGFALGAAIFGTISFMV
jgi:hypothetical protein